MNTAENRPRATLFLHQWMLTASLISPREPLQKPAAVIVV